MQFGGIEPAEQQELPSGQAEWKAVPAKTHSKDDLRLTSARPFCTGRNLQSLGNLGKFFEKRPAFYLTREMLGNDGETSQANGETRAVGSGAFF